jgi:hypothetical protein
MSNEPNEGWQKAATAYRMKSPVEFPEPLWTDAKVGGLLKLLAETCAKFYTGYAEPRPELLAAIYEKLKEMK